MSEEKQGWFSRLTSGLKKTTTKISDSFTSLVSDRKLDDEMLAEIEDTLIMADLGIRTAGKIIQNLKKKRFNQEITEEEVKRFIADEITAILDPVAKPLVVEPHTPHVFVMIGVNGSGKTTTIGKLAYKWAQAGYKTAIAAGDTFRAAAAEQLVQWGEKAGIKVITADQGADAASLAYKALETSKGRQDDILMIDTAGRLQNKSTLMEELKKIVRVIQKIDESAPHTTLLVLDATIGQNSIEQVKAFQEVIPLTGLIVTKLDGTAKGGVVVNLSETFGLPIYGVGVGESPEDLQPFDAKEFSYSLMGVALRMPV